MTPETSLIVVTPQTGGLPLFTVGTEAKQMKDVALNGAALIGHVRNADENTLAVRAQRELKAVSQLLERQRKKLKEPIIEAGRQLDRIVQAELAEIEQEEARIGNLTAGFQLAEQRRIREEEEAQRRELQRIEEEKQAELKCIADEQARVEREAREAREAAERQAREATNKKQREAAAEAQRVAAEQRAKAIEASRLAAAEAAKVRESAAAASIVESQPIAATRETGQRVTTDWEIQVTNPYELAKYHPDCVKIEPLLTPIKAALNQGREVKGITAKKIIKSHVTAAKVQTAIDV